MSTVMTELRKPISNDFNLNNGARFADFNGWNMPTFYTSIIEEYKATREHIGLFDVSHMGRWWVTGKDSEEFLNHIITNDLKKIKDGKAIYSPMCNEEAGIIDDLIIYKVNNEKFLLVNNAGNHDVDTDWYKKVIAEKNFELNLEDITLSFGQIAVQGPKAKEAVGKLLELEKNTGKEKLGYFSFAFVGDLVVAATGYTGEAGYELYGPNDQLMKIWQQLIDEHGAQACGLGSRDLLRLEAGYCLHGNDIDLQSTPYEAALNWTVSLDAGEFIGKENVTQEGKKLIGLVFEEGKKMIPRHGYKVFDESEKEIGVITSGNFSPILNRGIALAYIDINTFNSKAKKVLVEMRNKKTEGLVCDNWFYRNIRGVEKNEILL